LRLSTLVLPILLLLGVAGVTDARAGVPAPSTSLVTECVVATLNGSQTLHVVVRDLAGNPLNASYVAIELVGCPTAAFCTPPCTSCSYDAVQRIASRFTDASGVADFDLRAAGYCDTPGLKVYADGVLLASRYLKSADHDGSALVTSADVAWVHSRIGLFDLIADLDCDNAVTEADEAFAVAQLGTSCSAPVPVQPRSWGSLKLRYR
jgi:hypothetical protein